MFMADTWEFDGTNWTLIATSASPPGRRSHALAYDCARGRSVLFGGEAVLSFLDDSWEYDGFDWTPVATTVSPARRTQHALSHDRARGRMLLFGGLNVAGVWQEHGDTWDLLSPATPTCTRHGLGCLGSAGVPSLASTAAGPALGTTFPLQLTGLPAQPDLVYLAFGIGIANWNGAALPADLGAVGLPACKLWIDPITGIVLVHHGSTTAYALVLPNDPALANHTVATQALVFDPAAGNGIGSVSNAGIMRLF
jgi:hypothetical protein